MFLYLATYKMLKAKNKMVWLAYITLLFFGSTIYQIKAQSPFLSPLTLDVTNGLAHNQVNAVAEDHNGFAWLGTRHGVYRYDGITVEAYRNEDGNPNTLRHEYIHTLLPDSALNKVWVATMLGLSSIDTKSKQVKNYLHSPENPRSVPDNQASSFLRDRQGNLWIGFREAGLVKYIPETDDFERYECLGNAELGDELFCDYWPREILEDPNNDSLIWMGTQKGIVSWNKHTGRYRHFIYKSENKEEEQRVNIMRRMFFHTNGKIYFGTWYRGVYTLDTRTGIITPLAPCYSNGNFAFDRDVTSGFFQKSPHELYINSFQGMQLYDLRTGCITQTFINSEKFRRWYSIDHVDKKGRIWSISRTEGFKIYDPIQQQYEYLAYEDPYTEMLLLTRAIWEDTTTQKLYIATQDGKGLYIYDSKNKDWEIIPTHPEYKSDYKSHFTIGDMVELQKGELLLISGNKLLTYRIGDKYLRLYPTQLSGHPRLSDVIKAKDGTIWISGGNIGLVKLNPKTQKLTPIDLSHLYEKFQMNTGGNFIVEDKNGNIWLREHNGLLIYEKATGEVIYHRYSAESSKVLRSMGPMVADDAGRIWIATYRNKLAYAHADSLHQGIIKYYGPEDGLRGKAVNAIKFHKKNLLVFTDEGLQTFNMDTRRFEKYFNEGYGLSSYHDSQINLSDGRIAIGQKRAIVIFNPDSLKTNEEIPQPYISDFKVFGKRWDVNSQNKSDIIFLSYKQNHFSFEFSALGFYMPHNTQFQYKLEGFDEEWQDGTQHRLASYTNVPGGDYIFKVKAFNEEKAAQAITSQTFLSISTIWYKTIWFWCLATFGIAGIIYSVYQWQISQVRKKERLKAEYERKLTDVEMSALRAQMNPHFIFNSLNSIDYYIICNEQEKASDYLNRFSRLIRLILQNSKSSIVPLKDDLEALKLYIELESLRFDDLFEYEVKMEKGLDPEKINIPPMILQPYVENAIWHGLMQKESGKGILELSMRKNNGHLICLIEDNGIGREAAQKLKSKSASRRKSYGMKITSDRLAMLNKIAGADASVQIFDLKNEDESPAGTRVELSIPL